MSIFRNERLENLLSAQRWSPTVKTAGISPGGRRHLARRERRQPKRALGGAGGGSPGSNGRSKAAMHLDPYIVLGSAVVGLLVGLTGAGGGALMTPMLILLFGVKPSSAISSDLVAAVLMRPVGAAVHLYKKTVNLRLVGWMVCGSVPMAFVGAFLLHK